MLMSSEQKTVTCGDNESNKECTRIYRWLEYALDG
jgi:hypothetical protein